MTQDLAVVHGALVTLICCSDQDLSVSVFYCVDSALKTMILYATWASCQITKSTPKSCGSPRLLTWLLSSPQSTHNYFSRWILKVGFFSEICVSCSLLSGNLRLEAHYMQPFPNSTEPKKRPPSPRSWTLWQRLKFVSFFLLFHCRLKVLIMSFWYHQILGSYLFGVGYEL